MNSEANKRKILLITPDYMDYTDMIRAGIAEYLSAEVYLVTTTGSNLKFSYRNSFHRIQNFFSKLFLNKNQKKIFYKNAIGNKIDVAFDEQSNFDDILIIRPDLIIEHLPFIKSHGKRMIAYFWDSFARIPEGRETIKYFDKFFSFEPKNVKDHSLLFLPNFYPPDLTINKDIDPGFDLSYVASADERLATLDRILDSLMHLHLKMNINIVATETITNKNEKGIRWFTDVLPRNETMRIMNDSKVLLDIAQPKQDGLSFRIFEAMALEKKIITTNRSVATYNFYNPGNIFIWQNEGTIPSEEFFTTPYSPIPGEILKKYSLQSWVLELFKE